MKKNYIIDGYNLAFKAPAIAALMRAGKIDQAVRQVILHAQKNYAAAAQIIIVFDGRQGIPPEAETFGNIRVIFSKKPQTADDVIRAFLRNAADAPKWTVISSDHQIQNTAKDMGAVVLKSEQAWEPRKSQPTPRKEVSGEKAKPTKVDLDYWLDVFGEKKSK
jgi:predicted RNA-binding protein with PIN domain